jgi:dolichol-phosphate mannosyltransferase
VTKAQTYDSRSMMNPSTDCATDADRHTSVHPGHRVLAMFPFYNEEDKLALMAPRLWDGYVDAFVGVNDGSSDLGAEILRNYGVTVIEQSHAGVGACIKRAIKFAKERRYDILVVMAGNNKDNPAEIPELVRPIFEGRADYVQGSRFLSGGSSPNLPVFRWFAIKLLSLMFKLYTGAHCTDLTNGFRAYRLSLLDDPRINIWQSWLDGYEFEYYVHWKAYKCGYRVAEVPVTKTYPSDKAIAYTKVRPFTSWYQMLRPFVLLWLGIRK